MSGIGSHEHIRAVLRDNHNLFRRGLAGMLSVADDIGVANETNAQESAIIVVLSEEKPDVVLLDRHLASTRNWVGAGFRAQAMQKALANGWIPSFELSKNQEKDGESRHGAQRW